MEKRLTIVIGAGGTGSYLVPNLLNFYKGLGEVGVNNKMLLIDGDVVEEKNLLRQGFLTYHLNDSKATAIVDTYAGLYPDMALESRHTFINSADSLLNIVTEEIEDLTEVIMVSCVDNNYARLRMAVAQMMIKDKYPELSVTFVDSGNEEWHGQAIISHLSRTDNSLFSYDNGMVLKRENYVPTLDNIFVRNATWTENLTRGDHEISCDDIAESHPQNVATNMTASSVIIMVLGNLLKGENLKNIRFNTMKNTFDGYELVEEEAYLNRMEEIATFINNDSEHTVLSPVYVAMNKKVDKQEPVAVSEAVNTENMNEVNEIIDIEDISMDVGDFLVEVGTYTEEVDPLEEIFTEFFTETEEISEVDVELEETEVDETEVEIEVDILDIDLDDFWEELGTETIELDFEVH